MLENLVYFSELLVLA